MRKSEFSAKHQRVVKLLHEQPFSLVKSHEKMAEANQTLIVNNTRVLEHLCVVVGIAGQESGGRNAGWEYKNTGRAAPA